jgi:hypothetical protein
MVALAVTGATCETTTRGSNPSAQGSQSASTGPADGSTVASPSENTGPAAPAPPSSAPSTAPLIITSLSFHVGEVQVGYAAVALGATGGTPPYHWSISSGALPPGLAISGSAVSGTPTTGGNYSFTVRVSDSAGGAAGVGRSIAIASRLAVGGQCTTRCNVEVGCVTVCGHFGSLSGGVSPYSYSLTGGALPTGMSLSGLSVAGSFPPPPPAALFLPWSFTVAVTDAFGVTGKVTAIYYDYPHIAWTTTSATCAATVAPYTCTTTLTYSGGTPGSTQSVKVVATKPSLPAGTTFSAVAKGGTVTITVSTPKVNYFGTVDLVLVDSDPCGPSGSCLSGTATVAVRV